MYCYSVAHHLAAAAVRRVGAVLRSVLITVLDLAHVHAASASQQRGPPRRLSRPKENPKQKRETRISTGTSCHRDARSAWSCVWSLFFSLSRNGTRRGGAVAAASVLSCAYASCRAVALVCLHCRAVCSHCNGCQTQRASVQRHSFSLPRTQHTGLYLGAWPATPSAGAGGAALTRGFLPADPSSVPGS